MPDTGVMDDVREVAEQTAAGLWAQSALIGVRAKEAADCRLLVADTSAEPNPSLGNLLRAGFEQVGQPMQWVWKP